MTYFLQLSGSFASEQFKCSFDYTTRKLFGGFATVDFPTVQLVHYSDKFTQISRLWNMKNFGFVFSYGEFEAKRIICEMHLDSRFRETK